VKRGMRRHLIGFLFFVVTSAGSFWTSPVRFSELGRGSGLTRDLQHPCYFSFYGSSWWKNVTLSNCSFENDQDALDDWIKAGSEGAIISETPGRYVTSYVLEETTYYCTLLVEKKGRTDICSPSLSILLEFEKQKLKAR
jgi:hypothetical protein